MSEDDFAVYAFVLGTFITGYIGGVSLLKNGASTGACVFGATSMLLLVVAIYLYLSNRRKYQRFK